jgi:hypothetical protein
LKGALRGEKSVLRINLVSERKLIHIKIKEWGKRRKQTEQSNQKESVAERAGSEGGISTRDEWDEGVVRLEVRLRIGCFGWRP